MTHCQSSMPRDERPRTLLIRPCLRWLALLAASCGLFLAPTSAGAQSFVPRPGRNVPIPRVQAAPAPLQAPLRVARRTPRVQGTPAELLPIPSDQADNPIANQLCGESISPLNRTAVCPRCGVDEAGKCCCDNGRWRHRQSMTFGAFGQGEYVGPHRNHHVPRYRLRVDDEINLVYRLTRELNPREYEFNVGDELLIEGESLAADDTQGDADFQRQLVVLPDGTVTLPLIGPVRAAGRSVQQLREEIQRRSRDWYTVGEWTVTPVKVDTRLEDLRNAVDARAGEGGQSISLRVSPDGTVQPPALGSVCVQGLTLDEAKFEIDQRYAQAGFSGIEVTPILTLRAPTYVYVLGEVARPGRFTLERPTTVMQAIAMAEGWNIGGNLRQIVIFRRADDWRLIATKLNLQGALMGHRPTPADEIFLRDSDIVLVPKNPVQRIDDAIDLVFTQGVNELITFGSALGVLNLTFTQ